MLKLRSVQSPQDPAVGRFAQLQRSVYFDADLLIPASVIRSMLRTTDRRRSNFLLVAEEEQRLLGGTLFHYMAQANCGFSSFMGVDSAARGQGLGRRLHEGRWGLLDETAGEPVHGVFIDAVAPERLSPAELQLERSVGSDPVLRRTIFQKMGFRRVDVRYEQPVDGPNDGPVTNMDLLFCPRSPIARIPTEWVLHTLQAYWEPWLGAERTQLELHKLLHPAGGPWLELLPAETQK